MIDPLQNILHCADMILWARSKMNAPDEVMRWLAQIGEADHVSEIHRQIEEIKSEQSKLAFVSASQEGIRQGLSAVCVTSNHGDSR